VQAIKNLIKTGTKTMLILVLNGKNYPHLLQMMFFFQQARHQALHDFLFEVSGEND